MTKRFWDGSADTIGANLTGWTVRSGAPSRKPTYAAIDALAFKRCYLQLSDAATAVGVVSWDAVDADANRANFDIVTCVPWSLLTAAQPMIYARGTAFTHWYRLNLYASSIGIDKSVASVVSFNIGTASVAFAAGKNYFVRFRGNGTTLQARVWDAALGRAGEPSTWDISITDSGVTGAGWVGLGTYHASVSNQVSPFNFFAVATNGESADCPRTEAEFDLWCDDQTKRREVLAEFSVVGANLSTPPYTATRYAYLSRFGYTSAEQDTPSKRKYSAILAQVPTFSVETPAALGGEVRVSFGDLVVSNPAVEVPGATYLLLDGASGGYASTPDSAANSITGDIDIRVRVAMDDWTPGAGKNFVSKRQTAGQASYRFAINSGNFLYFEISTDGTTLTGLVADAALSFADGAVGWIRATRASASGDVKFYTSLDYNPDTLAGTWTQLGTTRGGASGAIFNSTSVVEIGTVLAGTTERLSGKVYRAQVLNGIAGTLALDFNLSKVKKGATAFDSTTGEAWTVNGSAKIRQAAPTQPGVRDDWMRLHTNRNYLRLWLGDSSWPRHDFRALITGRIGQPVSTEEGKIRFPISDLSDFFNRDIQEDLFSTGPYANQRYPIYMGQIGRSGHGGGQIEPPLTDRTNLIYTISDEAIGSWFTSASNYMRVYDRQVELKTVAFKFTISGANIFNTNIAGTPTDHGMVVNYLVRTGSSGTYPPELAADTEYWAYTVPGSNQLTLSSARGSSPIASITAGVYTGTLTGFGYTVTATAPASIQLASGNPDNMRITVSDILARGTAPYDVGNSPAEVYLDIAQRAGLSANFIDPISTAYTADMGYWVNTEKHTAAEVLAAVAQGTLTWYGFTPDGLFQTGDIALPLATPRQSFTEADIKHGSMKTTRVSRAVDMSKWEITRYPWFLTGGPFQSGTQAALQGKSFVAPATLGATSIPIDNYPELADPDRNFKFEHLYTTSWTHLDDYVKYERETCEMQFKLKAFRRSLGDQVQVTHRRGGWKQYSELDTVSPDNTASYDARQAVVRGKRFDLGDPFPVTLQLERRRPGYYPAANLS